MVPRIAAISIAASSMLLVGGPVERPASVLAATSGPCTATWTGVAATVTAGTWWSVATGEPQSGVYALSGGCTYDPATPANTPLTLPPEEQLPWVGRVDGVPAFVTDFRASTGEVTLLTDVDPGNTLQVDFFFDVLVAPTPTPTPVPSAGQVALIVLAAAFVISLAWRLKSRPSSTGRRGG